MNFTKKTILTLAMAGLSYGAVKAQDNQEEVKPSHRISVAANLKSAFSDDLGDKTSLIGVGVRYGQDFAKFKAADWCTLGYAWNTGIDFNSIHAENKRPDLSRVQSDVDIKQVKAVATIGTTAEFHANKNLSFGISVPVGVGVNFGIADGMYNWETGDFGIYHNTKLISPAFVCEPEVSVRYKNVEVFGGVKMNLGIIKKRNLTTDEKVFDEASFHHNNRIDYMTGLRVYLAKKNNSRKR